MPVQVNLSNLSFATFYTNQRKVDRCQNGVLWAGYIHSQTAYFSYSTDNGVTWNAGSSLSLGTTLAYNAQFSFFIDLDDYCHVVYKAIEGPIFYCRGTPNAGRTSWTWSAAELVYNGGTVFTPDIIAHREGTGWVAHIVYNYVSSSSYIGYKRVAISSGGTFTLSHSTAVIANIDPGYSDAAIALPSLDFHHTGDGKTVAGGTPHVFIAWGPRAPNHIKFIKVGYSAGVWTPDTVRDIDTTRYLSGASGENAQWLNCLFDGTRVIIGGVLEASGDTIMLYERDVADTTTTTRTILGPLVSADRLYYGSMSYDSQGNVYFFGTNQDEANNLKDLVYRKWTRSGASIGSEVIVDATVNVPYVSTKRGVSGSRIEILYTDVLGGGSYPIMYEGIVVNQTPTTPTALTVTSDVLDTTPTFSASISDPDTSQQIKGRFQIYQSDGTTLVGTVDSALRTGAGSVTAEYASALPVGTYKVQVATVDDAGSISSYTAQVTFNVKTQVTDDSILRWDVDELILDTLELKWNVIVSNQKDLDLLWNAYTTVQANDLTLRWSKYTPWVNVDPDPESPVTWEEVLA